MFDKTRFFSNIPARFNPWFPGDKPMWFILDNINEAIVEIYKNNSSQYKEIKENVFIGENTTIAESVEIKGPALIGKGCEIRHGAFLRENVIIGDNCIVGNSTEIKNSVLFNNLDAPHFNYIGDSILGNHVHLGAGAKISNVLLVKNKRERIEQEIKTTGKNAYPLKEVKIKVSDGSWIETGRVKFGAIIGDYAEIGVNTSINPGTLLEMSIFVPSSVSIGGYFKEGYVFPKNVLYEQPNP